MSLESLLKESKKKAITGIKKAKQQFSYEHQHRNSMKLRQSGKMRWLSKYVVDVATNLHYDADVIGKENVQGADVVYFKHQRYGDLLIGARIVRNGYTIGKKQLFLPGAGWLLSKLGTIPIDRDSKIGTARTYNLVLDVLERGEQVTIAPESTRVPGRLGDIGQVVEGMIRLYERKIDREDKGADYEFRFAVIGFDYERGHPPKIFDFRREKVTARVEMLEYRRGDNVQDFVRQVSEKMTRLSGLSAADYAKELDVVGVR